MKKEMSLLDEIRSLYERYPTEAIVLAFANYRQESRAG